MRSIVMIYEAFTALIIGGGLLGMLLKGIGLLKNLIFKKK